MGQLDPFLVARQDDRVIAGHRSAAQRSKADRASGPRPGDAVTPALAVAGQIDAAPPRRRFAEQFRGAAGRIDLVPVVHLDNLDIPVVTQLARRLLDQRRQHVDAERGIAGLQDGNRPGRLVDRGMMRVFEAGGADNNRLARRDAGIQRRLQRRRRGKIDQHIAARDQRRHIIPLVRAASVVVPRVGNGRHQRLPHPAPAADNSDSCHVCPIPHASS